MILGKHKHRHILQIVKYAGITCSIASDSFFYYTMNDKILHCIVGFCLSILGILFLPFILLGYIFGIGKEIYDMTGRGTPEINDVYATFIGAIIATLCLVAYKVYF